MRDTSLFLHVLAAMVLFGALLAAVLLALAGHARSTFASLVVAVPAWAATLACAYWIESEDHLQHASLTWLDIGHGVLEPGLVVLLAALGAAYWWRASGKPVARRIAAGLSSVYLLLLVVAFLAMSGKWG